jgi:hypothetical protein
MYVTVSTGMSGDEGEKTENIVRVFGGIATPGVVTPLE